MRRILAIALAAVLAASCTGDGAEATSTPAAAKATTTTAPYVAGAEGGGDPYYPLLGNGGYDVEHYDLAVAYTLDGTVTVDAAIDAVATQNLEALNLDFVGWTIDAVTIDGVDAAYRRDGGELTLERLRISSGSPFAVHVAYHGTPQPLQSEALPFLLGWFSGPDGEQFVVAQPDGAHAWFPGNDHPSDKATFSIRLTVPAGFVAAANGALAGVSEDDALVTYSWEMQDPMATYLATVVIGDTWEIEEDARSTDVSGVRVRNVLPPDIDDEARRALAKTGEMIVTLEDAFGPYPFDEYGIAVVGGFEHALENQTLSVFGRRMVSHPAFEYILVHELAHQWFGDSVSVAQWSDIWLNEGFATYAELLWVEHLYGPAAYREEVANRIEASIAAEDGPPGTPASDDLFNRTVYQRGSFVLVALRDTVGDDRFFEILHSHATRHAYGTATTDDFIALAEEISARDLDDLFDAWLYGDDLPAR